MTAIARGGSSAVPPTATHTSAGQGTARSSGDGRSARSFTVVKHNGKLALTAPVAYKQFVDTLGEGEELTMTLRSPKRTRSNQQNKWLWGVANRRLCDHLGYERTDRAGREAVHYEMVKRCFGSRRDERLGADIPNARSSQLSTKAFAEFMEWFVRHAAMEFGCVIPLPDECDLDEVELSDWEGAA